MSDLTIASIQILVGLVALAAGGELLVRGAAALAAAARISGLVIGLTVVAFGTSSPELAVAIQASLADRNELLIGNVVGSNICNILLILGSAAVVAPLVVASQLVRLDVPLMILVSLVTWLMALDGHISRFEGLVLFLGLIGYIALSIRVARSESPEVKREFEVEYARDGRGFGPIVTRLAFVVGGIALLTVGSNKLVEGAVTLAQLAGLSELVIGMTIVAVGTSLPELATSVVAALKGERDIAVGNVVGSNVFNLLGVLGLAAALAGGGVPVSDDALRIDLPVMVLVAAACLPFLWTRGQVDRWEGLLFFGYYCTYMIYRILEVRQSDAADRIAALILFVLVPLTLLTIVIDVMRMRRSV